MSTRYHSLSASVKTIPDVLAITAATEESGVIMGVRHRQFTIEAVQYHPESVLSEEGDTLLQNFLNLRGGTWDENPAVRVTDLSLPPFPIDGPKEVSSGQSSQASTSKLPTILEKIHTQRLKDIEIAKNMPGTSPEDLETMLSLNLSPPLIDFVDRLRTTPETSPALMAEIKRASPSKGPIALKANAAQQALTYAIAGASVVSVLTEPTWFKGSLLDMRLVRQALDALPNRPAVLRKDFIVDEYQITEARLHGADTVLLIVAMLPVPRLRALYSYAKRLGMEPLVEVNNAAEMEAALSLGARVIGVNNRNLHSFEVDMGTTSRLVDMVRGKDVILCALSGISGPTDVRTYAEQGVSAVLVGEALMKAKDTRAFIQELLGWSLPLDIPKKEAPLVKICGVRTVEEALAVTAAGADLLGLMFVPSSKRRISLDVACRISHAIRAKRAQVDSERSFASIEQLESKGQARNTPWFITHATRLSHNLQSGYSRPQVVGVFQDQPLEYILEVVAVAQLDAVQLHGSEPLHWANHIPVPVIRVFHVGSESKEIKGITRPGLHKFVLLDAMRSDGLSGGSGKTFDWEFARIVVNTGEVSSVLPTKSLSTNGSLASPDNNQEVGSEPPTPLASTYNLSKRSTRLPIILAGGLTPENITEAVARVRPWAVDVSGGVETSDGSSKDIEKVVNFIRAAKGQALDQALSDLHALAQTQTPRVSTDGYTTSDASEELFESAESPLEERSS